MHTYMHTYIHTYPPTYLPTYIHTYIPTYLRGTCSDDIRQVLLHAFGAYNDQWLYDKLLYDTLFGDTLRQIRDIVEEKAVSHACLLEFVDGAGCSKSIPSIQNWLDTVWPKALTLCILCEV